MKTANRITPISSDTITADSSAFHVNQSRPGSERAIFPRCDGRRGQPSLANTLISIVAAVAIIGVTAGCSSTTLFQSNFSANALNAAPAHTQATGTIAISGQPDSVLVVDAPTGANGHWAKITHPAANAPISTMLCNFSAVRGVGTYALIAAMHIPHGSGAATVEFDTSPGGSPPNTGFLHLDFLPDGTVRMDDDPNQIWGTYSHDRTFALSVTLDITATSATAHVSIIGSGTSGSIDYPVPLGKFAHQIGAVKIWMGSPWEGSFHVTDIVVTKRND